MKIGSLVRYKMFYEGWIGVIVSWGESEHGGELPDGCAICRIRWYDGSITEELIELIEVLEVTGEGM